MGYYARGEGYVILKPEGLEDMYSLERKLKERKGESFFCENYPEGVINTAEDLANAISCLMVIDDIAVSIDGKTAAVRGYYEYSKWYSDDYSELLDLVTPYCGEGHIEFIGDDDCFWRYVFRDGKWNEENGTICYPDDMPNAMTVGNIIWLFKSPNVSVVVLDNDENIIYEGKKNDMPDDISGKEVKKMSVALDGVLGTPIVCFDV